METNAPKVVVVGASYVDMIVKCSQTPAPAKIVTGSAFECSTSGPGPNQAVQAARCGCSVNLISKVGSDIFAELVKKKLSDYKINTDYIFTADAKSTGTVMTMVNGEGENTTCICCGANSALLPAEIESAEPAFAAANICLIHGSLPHQAISKVIRLAKLCNIPVILNPARPIDNTNEQDEIPIDYFANNILIPNLYEAAQIAEHSPANINTAKLIGSDLLAKGAKAAVITMGKRGCMVVDRSGADHIPAFDIELVDQTCTGDSFAGAIAAFYAAKPDIREAAKFASAAGALACTKFGTIDSLPSRADIIELLQRQEG